MKREAPPDAPARPPTDRRSPCHAWGRASEEAAPPPQAAGPAEDAAALEVAQRRLPERPLARRRLLAGPPAGLTGRLRLRRLEHRPRRLERRHRRLPRS